MIKFVKALIAALVVGLALAGAATSASAHYRHSGCCGGPVAPSYHYNTVYTNKFYTRYHDVSVYNHVHRIHKIVHITRIQPIVHVHIVTRIHHHTIVHTSDVHEHLTEYLPARHVVYGSTQNYYDCRCGHPRHCW